MNKIHLLNRLTRLVFFLIPVLLFIKCSNQSNTEQKNWTIPTVNEDDLLGRLSAELIASPRNLAEKDQNAMINYAIDKGLDVYRTPSGIYIQLVETGAGASPKASSDVVAHYRGRFLDGKEFDSSYKRNKPLSFNLQQVIRGWQEGLQLLKSGGKAILLIPSHLAYGSQGFPGSIPPDAVLRFDIELLEIKN